MLKIIINYLSDLTQTLYDNVTNKIRPYEHMYAKLHNFKDEAFGGSGLVHVYPVGVLSLSLLSSGVISYFR